MATSLETKNATKGGFTNPVVDDFTGSPKGIHGDSNVKNRNWKMERRRQVRV
jgi:hypothetical protein